MVYKMKNKYIIIYCLCCIISGCSTRKPAQQHTARTTQQYVEFLENFMQDFDLDKLAVAVCVNRDWTGQPRHRPHFVTSYKILYSFDPLLNLGDVITDWVHFDDPTTNFWRYANKYGQRDNLPKFYFIGADHAVKNYCFFAEDIVVPNDNGYVNKNYHVDGCWVYEFGFVFSFYGEKNIETNKLFEAYFILQERYRNKQTQEN